MLSFHSASARIVNSDRAIAECLDITFPDGNTQDCRIAIINASLGHSLEKLGAAMKKYAPHVALFGSSCGGVIGREGVGESMHDLGLMMISGPTTEIASASVASIYGQNSYAKGLELAQKLQAGTDGIHTVYLLCPGIDIANDLVLKAFVETFGEELTIFGGTSSDNMRGLISYQYHDAVQSEHDAWAIGFADKTLNAITRATHGFAAYGTPLVVTKAEGNKIYEFDGRPAWERYTELLSLPAVSVAETIPVGALAEKLPPDMAEEYGNAHILRAITKHDPDGPLYYPVTCQEGLEVWLTTRDENLIFSEQQRSLDYLTGQIGGGTPVAVFQADCLARGRLLFNRVVKDEIIGMMYNAFTVNGEVPPWLGMYGFGEYTKLGGKNAFHNYSTALLIFYR
jgi:hypothetical protein